MACVAVWLTSLSPAGAAVAGGVAAPAREGGAEYGAPLASAPMSRAATSTRAARPVARLFQVSPRDITSGAAPPAIVVRIDQRGVRSVRARIVFLPLGGPAQILRIDLGRVRTGRRIEVAWPQGAVLAAGRYVVRLHARGPGGSTLLRRARTAGRTALEVHAPEPPPAPLPPPTGMSPAGVFPVAGPHSYGGPDARFGAPRDGHIHQGQDVMAAEGTPVVAPLSGTITVTSYQAAGAGYYVVQHASDGRDFFFAHCHEGSVAVAAGAAVAAGQPVCAVGHTGTATGPHLHFEIWIGGWRVGPQSYPIDPLPDLLAWDPTA